MEDKLIREHILIALKKVEGEWSQVKDKFFGDLSESLELEKARGPSNIPGYEIVWEGKPKVGTFIAFMLDMRKSSKHLMQASNKTSATGMERVLYETTALNAMGMLVFQEQGGGITEFLGDGFLGFFLVDDLEDKEKAYKAYNAAKACLRITQRIINPLIHERYGLEPLNIGIGMAYSQAMITLVGAGANLQPKAIGECVYRASKLCKGPNTISIDRALKFFWPKREGGPLTFVREDTNNDFASYTIQRRVS